MLGMVYHCFTHMNNPQRTMANSWHLRILMLQSLRLAKPDLPRSRAISQQMLVDIPNVWRFQYMVSIWIIYGWSDDLWIIYRSGWWYTYPSEKYEFVDWDDCSQYVENKTCSKPPTNYPCQRWNPLQYFLGETVKHANNSVLSNRGPLWQYHLSRRSSWLFNLGSSSLNHLPMRKKLYFWGYFQFSLCGCITTSTIFIAEFWNMHNYAVSPSHPISIIDLIQISQLFPTKNHRNWCIHHTAQWIHSGSPRAPPGWQSSASTGPPRAAPRAPSPAAGRANAGRRERRPGNWRPNLKLEGEGMGGPVMPWKKS